MFIDSHVHLDDARYDADRPDVFQRAQDAGVETVITIGCDLETSRAAVSLAEQHAQVYATVGIHPHEVKHIQREWYDELRALSRHPKVVAYGEIGLDYHYDHSPRDIQRTRFQEQIHLAGDLGLPLVIHTREAQDDTIDILKKSCLPSATGVFHCFSGDASLAKDALDLGFFLSFSGVITFRNATNLRELIATVPLDHILIETDCPYLTPVPYRGKRNEPAFVTHVAETIASVKGHGLTAADIGRITSDNAKRLFKIP